MATLEVNDRSREYIDIEERIPLVVDKIANRLFLAMSNIGVE